MLTAVISDLHLGMARGLDVLSRPDLRRILLAELEGVDRVVLLGDVIELRDRPLCDALRRARPFFEDLAAGLGDARLVVVPGNHDHHLAAAAFGRRRGRTAESNQLGLEQLVCLRAGDSHPLAPLADCVGGEVTLAYPGLWIRPDVYATHGHYLDGHRHALTMECLAAAVVARVRGALPEGRGSPDDYEAVLAPIYGLIFTLAQVRAAAWAVAGAKRAVRGWERLSGTRGTPGAAGQVGGRVLLPPLLWVLDRLGLGRFDRNRSDTEPRPSGLEPMAEVVSRLAIDARHVVFGHTHRAGPLEDDADGWRAGRGRLTNTGSWVYEPAYVRDTGALSPYWPGNCVFVGDSGPPRLERILAVLSAPELEAALGEARA